MRGVFPPHPIFLGSALDPDAARWIAAVGPANVSQPRGFLISDTIRELKAAGVWADLDYLLVMTAENTASALVDWRARKTSAPQTTVVTLPTFTTDRGYAFDGSTNYLSTGFTPSTDSVAATGTSFMLGVYERTNVASSTASIGAANGTNQAARLIPRTAGNVIATLLNAASVQPATSVSNSTGLTVTTTDGVNANGYKNGSLTALSPLALTTPGTDLTTYELYISAHNSSGTALNFRAATLGYAMFGRNGWTAVQHSQFYNIMQRYMTRLGANV